MPQSFAEELSSIPTSPNLGQSLERAHRFAREQSHRVVTLEHLLLALTDDAEAALILQAANIDLGRLTTDVSGYLGRLLEDMRGDGASEPRPDAELLRVLQAAASAAKQSRRRQIDGAIVLAAIVGDGKSPAAGLLKALGMTFEEAIRALQRANTKARLKPTPKAAAPSPAQAAAAPPATPRPRADAEPAAANQPAHLPETVAAAEPASPAPSQSAEEILAAARARIQRRSADAASEAPRAPRKPDPAAVVAEDSEPPPEPADTTALTAAIEAAMTITAARGVEPASPLAPPASADSPAPAPPPPAPPLPQAARPAWTPPAEPRPPPAQRLPQPPPARPQPPFPGRAILPGEGPRRPPLPPSSAGAGQPQPGFPNRPPRAPWPEPAEPGIAARAPVANGSYAETPPPPPPAPLERPAARGAQPPWSAPVPRGGGQTEKGLLVESVPRRMRVGVPASAEVRIARDRIESLIVALNGRGPAPLAEQSLTRALSVRLRAPGGDFWIEPAAPETQWVESGSSLIHDDHAVWRWTVVARRRGRGRLSLMVSARTVGRDGVAAESAPPDRVIEVKIGANYRQSAGRWVGWIVAMLAGALIGRFGAEIWALVTAAIKKTLGG